MTYDDLLVISDNLGLITKEKDLQAFDGRIKGSRIAIRRSIPTTRKKSCILAEELGHYFTSSGNVLEDTTTARKQERKARRWAYDIQVGLAGIVDAYTAGCHNLYEIADYLDITENFLSECLKDYHQRFGSRVKYGRYLICFDPYLEVIEE